MNVSRTCARAALTALGTASLLLTQGCSTEKLTAEQTEVSPYKHVSTVCLMTREDIPVGLTVTLEDALEERGFRVVRTEPGSRPKLERCRMTVNFEVSGSSNVFEPGKMALSSVDRYTGESYYVSTVTRKTSTGLLQAPGPDPVRQVRRLVDRLFPLGPLR